MVSEYSYKHFEPLKEDNLSTKSKSADSEFMLSPSIL